MVFTSRIACLMFWKLVIQAASNLPWLLLGGSVTGEPDRTHPWKVIMKDLLSLYLRQCIIGHPQNEVQMHFEFLIHHLARALSINILKSLC